MPALLGLAVVVSCGSDGPTEPPVVITSVAITTRSPTLSVLGDSIRLEARVENSEQQVMSDAEIAWTSSAPTVATVSKGMVVAGGNGTTVVTASAGGHSDTTTVTVFTVHALAITPVRPTLGAIGDSATLVAAPTDGLGGAVHDVSVTWESSLPTVATVDKGIIVAKANGTTLLTARVGSLVDTTTVTVSQRPAQLAFLTQPGTQFQGHVMGEAVEVAVADARGVRLSLPTAPIEISVSAGALTGTTSRVATDGIARFDDLVVTEPGRAETLTAHLGALSASSIFFSVQLALTSISAGGAHTCGLTSAGNAYCWGYQGRTGDGSTTARTTPVRVSGAGTYRAVVAGSSSTWAFGSSGDVVTWGSTAVPFATAQTFTSLSADWFTCGITTDQLEYCWGARTSAFGSDAIPDGSAAVAPTLAMGGRAVLAVAPGMAHSCMIAAADSTAWCAGNNPHGELGDGTISYASVPVAVAGGLKFKALSAGNEFTCGIVIAGDTYCWGRNDQGQLGDPNETALQSTLPRLVSGGHHFRMISAGGTSTCGLIDDGTAYCWGNNSYGMLGSAGVTAASSAAPLAVSGGVKFDVLSVGGFHACGIATTGVSYCWGDWSNGATGTGSGNTNDGPVAIAIPET